MDELVQRLSEGDHPVIASRAESAEELKQSFDFYFDTHAAGFERGTGGG